MTGWQISLLRSDPGKDFRGNSRSDYVQDDCPKYSSAGGTTPSPLRFHAFRRTTGRTFYISDGKVRIEGPDKTGCCQSSRGD